MPADRRIAAADAKWEKGLYHPLRRHFISSPVLLAAISGVIPLIGLTFGLLLRAGDNANNKRIGKWCLMAAAVGLVCLLSLNALWLLDGSAQGNGP